MDVHVSDLVTIALLVAARGAAQRRQRAGARDLVLGLPRRQQRQALRYGILGAFVFRILATLLAVHLIRSAG